MNHYQRVAQAIAWINEHAEEQPGLDEVAEAVHLSPYYFHRVFREWAGVTPKEFLQYISLDRARKLLEANHTLEETTHRTGLSSSSRLHDLFVHIEGMTPGEYKSGGRALEIRYRVCGSPFGQVLIASTGKGICNLFFVDDVEVGARELQREWPNAWIEEGTDEHMERLVKAFEAGWGRSRGGDGEAGFDPDDVRLHIRGTGFQIKVWEALLKIPSGKLVSYSDIADVIGKPKASRAVGSAVGRNPVSLLIPCHRVIKKAGVIGDYRWGSTRKTAMIGWEGVGSDK